MTKKKARFALTSEVLSAVNVERELERFNYYQRLILRNSGRTYTLDFVTSSLSFSVTAQRRVIRHYSFISSLAFYFFVFFSLIQAVVHTSLDFCSLTKPACIT